MSISYEYFHSFVDYVCVKAYFQNLGCNVHIE